MSQVKGWKQLRHAPEHFTEETRADTRPGASCDSFADGAENIFAVFCEKRTDGSSIDAVALVGPLWPGSSDKAVQ